MKTILAVLLIALAVAGCASAEPSPTPTHTIIPTVTPTPTPTAMPTWTPAPNVIQNPTPFPSPTPAYSDVTPIPTPHGLPRVKGMFVGWKALHGNGNEPRFIRLNPGTYEYELKISKVVEKLLLDVGVGRGELKTTPWGDTRYPAFTLVTYDTDAFSGTLCVAPRDIERAQAEERCQSTAILTVDQDGLVFFSPDSETPREQAAARLRQNSNLDDGEEIGDWRIEIRPIAPF